MTGWINYYGVSLIKKLRVVGLKAELENKFGESEKFHELNVEI